MASIKKYASIFKQYEDVVTVKELQQMLRIGRNTAYKLLRENQIKHKNLGGKIILAKTDVIRYIASSN